jgi:bifunctional DNA-binding transcriptional regulator/antitoxin component of YhaV-PrlF toxin-antitoxin module
MSVVRILGLSALLAVVACGSPEPSANPGNAGASKAHSVLPAADISSVGVVFAKVEEASIGSTLFDLDASRATPADGAKLSLEEKRDILDGLVTEEILFQEATKEGLYLDPKVKKIMVNLLLRQNVYAKVKTSDFTPEELRAHYDAHQEEFVVPEKIQIKRIFLKVRDDKPQAVVRQLAEDLQAKVKANPDSFKDLAAEYSEDPYRRRGGDLGYVSREGKPGIDDSVIAKAFELEVGQVSEAFEAAGGFNILLVANKRERVVRTFEQMKGSVLRKLKNERYKQLTDEYIDSIRSGYSVSVEEQVLADYKVGNTRGINLGPDVEKARFNPGQGASGLKAAGLPLGKAPGAKPLVVEQLGER